MKINSFCISANDAEINALTVIYLMIISNVLFVSYRF